jgi:hypothetical protein
MLVRVRVHEFVPVFRVRVRVRKTDITSRNILVCCDLSLGYVYVDFFFITQLSSASIIGAWHRI